MTKKISHHAWVVTVDMGYGHQRASFPLRRFARGGVICANSYRGIPDRDKFIWKNSRKFYEFISRFKKVPFLGEKAFDLFDKLQAIPGFYPKRDLSRPNIQLKEIYGLFEKEAWGKDLVMKMAKNPLPLITSFFVTAFMAEYFNYPGEIYCLTCDADISRTWAPLDPRQSRINYFAPNRRVAERLKLYGVKPEQIFLTGFPLPEENVGNNLKIIKEDLGRRLIHLDPEKIFISQYRETIIDHLGRNNLRITAKSPVTITFAVGGAGAQRELGGMILQSLKKNILAGQVKINLIAGINPEVNDYFKARLRALDLNRALGRGIEIIFEVTKDKYFSAFDRVLRTTDVLWTKPSELSFYCGLGLPIVMAPPIGSQEIFNQMWLTSIGAGIIQEDPRYTNEWLFDWLRSGWLAEAAMQGFLEAPKYGTYNIEKIVFHETHKAKRVTTVLQY